MLGRKLSQDELGKIHKEQEKDKDKGIRTFHPNEIKADLASLLPGECMAYEIHKDSMWDAHLAFYSAIGTVPGLHKITKGNTIYIYREKA